MIHLLRQSGRGEFHHEMEEGDIFSYLPQCDNYCFASTGRSLISLLIKQLGLTNEDTCMMPAYVAEGVIQPFIQSGVNVQFYSVDEQLFAKPEALETQIENDSSIKLLVLIHPFGFEQPIKSIKKRLSHKKIHILEDCAQSLFCKNAGGDLLGREGGFSLFSLNKYLPVPDGAILQSHYPTVKVVSSGFEPESEERKASIRNYMEHLHLNFEMFESNSPFESKEILEKTGDAYDRYYAFINRNLSLYLPSPETRSRLKAINFEKVVAQRIINTRFLYENLKNNTFRFIYETWDENCIPMTVPVYVDPGQRNRIVSELFDQNILLSTLIDKWDFIPRDHADNFLKEKQFIDSHLLIPVNEFISISQMEKMVKILNKI